MNAPAQIHWADLGFDRHLELLGRLLPGADGFMIRDTSGKVIASSSTKLSSISAGAGIQLEDAPSSRVSRISNDYGARLYALPLLAFTGQPWAELLAVFPDETAADGEASQIGYALELVGGMLDNEYRLLTELDAMAEELADRYEELNLVYDNVYELLEMQSQGDAINHVVEHCAEHLNVGIVALVFANSDKVYYAVSEEFATRPYELIKHYDQKIIAEVARTAESYILNQPGSERDELGLQLPYKVLAAPVLIKRNDVSAALICITGLDDDDFMNSDRNLLEVMAKRISKIIQANRDDLTGLMNLRVLEVVMKRAVNSAREEGVFHSFLNIDIHQLKVINDTWGREVGDRVIEHAAAVLLEALRATDNIGYLGEGRFGILLEHCSMEEGLKVADSLKARIEQTPFNFGKDKISLSVSVGGTLIEPHTKNFDDILEAAEIARDAAKQRGQDRVRAYLHDDEDLNSRREEMRWVSRIQSALRKNLFRLHCQSIVPAQPIAEDFHFEVLLRLVDDDEQIVSPALFIPPAERFNLMPEIDRWVIEHTLARMRSSGLCDGKYAGTVSINLSGLSLDDPKLVEHIQHTLHEFQVPPQMVCFEITETAAVGHLESARDLLEELKSTGCSLSLDDFGTGLSSFSYLKSLPVDVLKIDGSFVKNILEDPVSEAMVRSINEVGQVMHLKTVAEFVENDAIAAHLRDIGVDYLQGFGLAKPEPMDTYLAALHKGD